MPHKLFMPGANLQVLYSCVQTASTSSSKNKNSKPASQSPFHLLLSVTLFIPSSLRDLLLPFLWG